MSTRKKRSPLSVSTALEKTTLLKIIMGEESADSGQVVIAKDTTIGYLSQHQDISFDNTIYGEMLATKQYILD